MPNPDTKLPNWIAGRQYCTVKDLMRLFEVSRATIDRWCRKIPEFPKKRKLGVPGCCNCSTRFIVSEVEAYQNTIESY